MARMRLQGWRTRRTAARARARPLRARVDGEGPLAAEIAERIHGTGLARISPEAPADVVIVCDDGQPPAELAARVRSIALWAARACPSTVLVIAAAEGLPLCRAATLASGLQPRFVLALGALPRATAEAARLARRLGVAASQVTVPVIGGDSGGSEASLAVLIRHARVAGVPVSEVRSSREVSPCRPATDPASTAALAGAAVAIARAVLSDSGRVLCCGAWVEGAYGLPGGFVSVPVPVGAGGAEEPLPLDLTLDERALLQRVSVPL